MPNMASYMPGMPNRMAHMLQQPGLRAPAAAAMPNMAAQTQVGAACILWCGACTCMCVGGLPCCTLSLQCGACTCMGVGMPLQ